MGFHKRSSGYFLFQNISNTFKGNLNALLKYFKEILKSNLLDVLKLGISITSIFENISKTVFVK